MPRRLPEKIKSASDDLRRFGKDHYQPWVFQGIPVSEEAKIDVVIAEKTTV